jgi:hypothetical protein
METGPLECARPVFKDAYSLEIPPRISQNLWLSGINY